MFQIGSDLGIKLPKEVKQPLQAQAGTILYFTASPDGSYLVSSKHPDFKETTEIAERCMNRYANTLCELAK